MKPFCDHCGQRRNAVGARRRQVFNSAASSRAVKACRGYESSDWATVPRLATRKRSKDIRPYRTSALRDTDTLLDENDLKAKQDDVNTKRIPEPMANALSSRGPREREIRLTTAKIH
mmetsp:Transcript_15196/g.34231  ORF Transcript_15196/g.34231 Transcript_15196/m.34231 type:complete len:117 (-) Transcript_15196:178-528(-)